MRVGPDSDFPDLLLSFISAAALSLFHFFLAVQKEMKNVFLKAFLNYLSFYSRP